MINSKRSTPLPAGKTIPKTAKEALLRLPKTRKLIEALDPQAKVAAMRGIQMKLDAAR